MLAIHISKVKKIVLRNRGLSKELTSSFILLTLSAVCQFAGDFLFTKLLDAETIASYFNFRSFYLIFSSFVLLGNGTSIVREKTLDRRYISFGSTVQNFLLSTVTTYVYCLFFLKEPSHFWYYLVGLIIYSHSRILFAIKQSDRKINASIYYSEFWRVFLMVLFMVSYYVIKVKMTFVYLVLITFISFGSVIIDLIRSIFLFFKTEMSVFKSKENFKRLYGFGYLFFIFGITLNASTFIDQLIVTTYIDPKLSANYIAHITIFMSPLLFLNKFLTSFAAPFLRDDLEKIIKKTKGRLNLILIGFTILMILCCGLSIVCFKVFYKEKYELIYSIAFFIWFTGILRILYILPSSIVGMRGDKQELHSFLFGNIAGLVAQLIVSAIGIYFFKSLALQFIIWAMLINWLIRLGAGFSNIVKIMHR